MNLDLQSIEDDFELLRREKAKRHDGKTQEEE